ncbi:MAG TPA: CDP-alcohol phosphatidyltransferase family protein [Gemmataceae bacterium]|jgi:phosphatidylcholine synthase|nr:CDP-alcohol phosphatidyltransferase family protein [Gemmataceae bacterium]
MKQSEPSGNSSTLRWWLAWAVHFYTGTGLLAAAGIAVLLTGSAPGPNDYRRAFILMLIATCVDATDGTLARWVDVKHVVPGFDGRRLDDLIDFLTYTCLPLLLIWRAEIVPVGQSAWLLVPLMASAYGFCQVSAKTEDGFFLGFPSYWNLVAFYLYLLHPPEWLSLGLILFLAGMTFVPCRYLYPTHRGRLNRLTLQLGVVWAIFPIWILANLSSENFPAETPASQSVRTAVLLSMMYPEYYLALSWIISLRIWQRARREAALRRSRLASEDSTQVDVR